MLIWFEHTLSVQSVGFVLLTKKFITAEFESLQDNPELEEGYCRALLCRLRFRKVLTHVSFQILHLNCSV